MYGLARNRREQRTKRPLEILSLACTCLKLSKHLHLFRTWVKTSTKRRMRDSVEKGRRGEEKEESGRRIPSRITHQLH